jgi:hypothetical protein
MGISTPLRTKPIFRYAVCALRLSRVPSAATATNWRPSVPCDAPAAQSCQKESGRRTASSYVSRQAMGAAGSRSASSLSSFTRCHSSARTGRIS